MLSRRIKIMWGIVGLVFFVILILTVVLEFYGGEPCAALLMYGDRCYPGDPSQNVLRICY